MATGACKPGTLPLSRSARAESFRYFPRLRTAIRRVAGFTLLELMVVLLIIGLLAHLAVANISQPSEYKKIQQETRRLAHLLSLAGQYASLNSRLVGIRLGKHSYTFMQKTDDGWETMTGKLFKARKLPSELVIELKKRPKISTKTEETADADVKVPDLLISSSGELTPFQLSITGSSKISHFVLTGSFSGRISIKTVAKNP